MKIEAAPFHFIDPRVLLAGSLHSQSFSSAKHESDAGEGAGVPLPRWSWEDAWLFVNFPLEESGGATGGALSAWAQGQNVFEGAILGAATGAAFAAAMYGLARAVRGENHELVGGPEPEPVTAAGEAPSPDTILQPPSEGTFRIKDVKGKGHYNADRTKVKKVNGKTVREHYKHKGVDWTTIPGQDIPAPASGRATIGASGESVFIDMGNDLQTRVLYIEPTITNGQQVTQGQVIGKALDITPRYPGITNHVHIELRYNFNGQWIAIDPTRSLIRGLRLSR